MPESYGIRLAKERFVFSAAHFITYDGDVCEPLHGHNYHVTAELDGPLDENSYVADFIAVRDALQRIVDALDHRVLLATEHPTIHVAESPTITPTDADAPEAEETVSAPPTEIIARHGDRRWVFPRQDCVLLPVANTTAELLARYIGGELLEALESILPAAATRLTIAVDECDGQWGVYSWRG